MNIMSGRRTAMRTFGMAMAAGAAGLASLRPGTGQAAAGMPEPALPRGAPALVELTDRLAKAPRRRDFTTVPMILNSKDLWDHEAYAHVLAYKPVPKQVWDNTDILGPWLNVMRNSLNAQIWSFDHPNFLVVSATHGAAQYALYDQAIWDKYGLAKLASKDLEKNTLIVARPAAAADPANYQDPAGVYSPQNNSIPALQQRGVVFMACHNAIWEHAIKVHDSEANPDKLPVDALAADLTNHLIPGVVLIPGAVATMVELQQVGFQYAR